MNYFDLYSSYPDHTIAAWDSQVKEVNTAPWIAETLNQRGNELFPRFAACYAELRALPRGARRSLQRRLARSSELAAVLSEHLHQGGRRLQHRMAWSLAGAALLLALSQGIATAATINVTTTNPKTKQDKKCSLIEAIVNANADAQVYRNCPAGSGADTIVLPANANIILTHETRDRESENSWGPTGLPMITSPIIIQGNGATIARSNRKRTRPFGLIAVSETGELTLENVTLSGGHAGCCVGVGGAILNRGALVIQNSTISGNTAVNGGGVFNHGSALTITNSTISGNSGGGVANWGGTLTIDNSMVSDNQGGGIANRAGALAVKSSTISGNSAQGDGGGVANWGGTLTIDNSMVSDNQARNGGGVFNDNRWVFTANSTASQNSVEDGPFCFYFPPDLYGPGGIACFYLYSGSLTIAGSTIAGNSAQQYGGGVSNLGVITIQNSSVSGNKAAHGGGISNPPVTSSDYYGNNIPPGSVNLVESEISDNLAYQSGGGLFNYGSLNTTNSSVSNNHAPVGPDIFP